MTAELVEPREPSDLAMAASRSERAFRVEAGRRWPLHVWRFDRPLRAISSAPYGGGLGERHWVLNATVPRDYDRHDPDAHVAELAAGLGLTGAGTGMLTAVDVNEATVAAVDGVSVVATVGLGYPTRAADPDPGAEAAADLGSDAAAAPADAARVGSITVGTINIVAFLPVPLSDAALVNAVATVTEAKVQALADYGLNATGTATDAVFLACPVPGGAVAEPYGGPRSTWGWRLARAVHAAIIDGTRRWHERTGRG